MRKAACGTSTGTKTVSRLGFGKTGLLFLESVFFG